MIRIKVKVNNAKGELIEKGYDKVLFSINKSEIKSISELKGKLNNIYASYGIVEKLMDGEGFLLYEKENVWNLIKNEDVLTITLNYLTKRDIILSDSDDDDSESVSKKIKKDNKFIKQKRITKYPIKMKVNNNNRIQFSSSSSSEEEEEEKTKKAKKKEIRNVKKNNNKVLDNKNASLPLSLEQVNEIKTKWKINVELNKLILIPSDKIEDIKYMEQTYPSLFIENTLIAFKIGELGKDGLKVSNYKIGRVKCFSKENDNSFLIELLRKEQLYENSQMMMMYYTEEDESLLCVLMKNFIELWILLEPKAPIEQHKEVANEFNYLQMSKNENKEEVAKPFIKRQIEYYFSDKNYYKDSFLLGQADEKGCMLSLYNIFSLIDIGIDVIMSFNKIKIMTSNANLVIESLKESNIVEFNEDYSKIRKKCI